MSDKALVVDHEKPLATASVKDATSMLQMIGQMASCHEVDIDKVERLMAMQVQMQDRENEAAFNAALASAESEIGIITKNKFNDQTRSSYSDLGAIVGAITPVYTRHGISLSFDSRKDEDGCVPVVCYVSACGHTREYTYHSPLTAKGIKGTVMMTDAHARGSAISYGRRYLTCMIFNIATADDDGNAASEPPIEYLSSEQVANISAMLDELGRPEGAFLKWFNSAGKCNINSISQIPVSWYGKCIKKLEGMRK